MNPEHFDFAAHDYLLALNDGMPMGYLEVSRSQRKGDPLGKVWSYLTLVHEEEAVIRALYERLETFPGLRSSFTMTHESLEARQRTLMDLGYQERLRSYGAVLEVAAAALSNVVDPAEHLGHEGIGIHTLAELRKDTAYRDKLFALYLETQRDVPEVGQLDTMTHTQFATYLNEALPEAYHIALHEVHYVGYSELFAHPSKAMRLRQETTAVLASYRRRGIALALKLRGLTYAKEHDYTHIHTGMASNNTAIVTLNTRLGFVPQAAYITFSKAIR